MIPACDIHEPGDPLCHWPRQYSRKEDAVEPHVEQKMLAQILGLRFEIAFYSVLIIGIVTYAKLGS